jgi:hypothetical protein
MLMMAAKQSVQPPEPFSGNWFSGLDTFLKVEIGTGRGSGATFSERVFSFQG